MIKQIYTTGQAIQNELNHLYPKEHEDFVIDYYGFLGEEKDDNDVIITVEKLQGFIEYIQEEIDDGYGGRKGIKTMFERVIKIMELHNIDAVNIFDRTESKPVLLDANIKDLNDYNARNTNFIEVQNHFCYLPERAKELINKHIDEDNGANYYTEYTYDVGGKYFISDALDFIENIQLENTETEEEKAFYTELKAVLKQISCDVIHY